jgi:4-diphosphocytidyl-2-C-methyl-D-erythritol kinase
MIAYPNAKINLGLHVVNKRPDGYHQIETVFYPIALSDILEIAEVHDKGKNQACHFEQTGIPIDLPAGENICVKAYELLSGRYPLPSVKMHLHKIIPVGSGLGGGSSDGTATLILLNSMFNLGIDPYGMASLALQLGSDCPYFVFNEPMLATGRGEVLTSLKISLEKYFLLIVHPGFPVSTRWAYEHVLPSMQRIPLSERIAEPVYNWKDRLINQFEEAVFHQYRDIKHLRDTLYQMDAVYASLSGSGSAVYGLFNNRPRIPREMSPYFTWVEKLGPRK